MTLNLDTIKARLMSVPPLRPYATARGGVVLINGPFELPKAHAAVEFVACAPADIAALLDEVEQLRQSLAAVVYFWEKDPEAFGDDATLGSMAVKFAAVARQCQVALRGDDNA